MTSPLTGVGTRPESRSFILVGSLALAIVALLAPGAPGWLAPAMLILPAWAAWAVRRESLIVAIFLAQTTVYYGVSWLILRPERPPELVALVVLWSAGITIGCLVGPAEPGRNPKPAGGPVPVPADRKWSPPSGAQFALAIGLLTAQAYLIVAGRLGYQAQLSHGESTPTGVLGTAASLSPVITMLVLVSALGSGRLILPAVVLGAAETTVLSLSGFRGAGIVFLVAFLYLAALILPKDSPWRRPRRILLLGPVLAVLLIVSFLIAAQVKSETAADLRVSSQGTQLFGVDEAVTAVATRLDFSDPLQRAIALRENVAVQDAVLWTKQAEAVIPRFLWPDKPVNDYGQRVTMAISGLESSRSSSTLTIIGDSLVNFGWVGVLICGLLFGALVKYLERRIRASRSWPSLVMAASLAYCILSAEVSMISFAVALLRTFAFAALFWGATVVIVGWRPAPTINGSRRALPGRRRTMPRTWR